MAEDLSLDYRNISSIAKEEASELKLLFSFVTIIEWRSKDGFPGRLGGWKEK